MTEGRWELTGAARGAPVLAVMEPGVHAAGLSADLIGGGRSGRTNQAGVGPATLYHVENSLFLFIVQNLSLKQHDFEPKFGTLQSVACLTDKKKLCL